MDIFHTLFGQYYGLDWAAMAFGFYGSILVTNKNLIGFLFSVIAALCAFIVAIMSDQYGFVFANLIHVAIAMRGYMLWSAEIRSKEQVSINYL